MRSYLVTGANKGIGRAIVQAVLGEHDDCFVFLGSRNRERGEQARAGLLAKHPSFDQRIEVVDIDVSSDDSVAAAAERVVERCEQHELSFDGLVNNAGLGFGDYSLEEVLQVNTLGVHRVCERFMPMLHAERGRVVNITSAAGPNFVNSCKPDRQAFFCDPKLELAAWRQTVTDCLAMQDDPDAIAAAGMPSLQAYGLSKAFANSYTMIAARLFPRLAVNACTPGFIETDMTRGYAEAQGKAPAELGMKPPEAATRAPLFLLFGELDGNGRYYGSDALRSPLDRYRSPGDPPFDGD